MANVYIFWALKIIENKEMKVKYIKQDFDLFAET